MNSAQDKSAAQRGKCDSSRLFLLKSQFSAQETVKRLEKELNRREIPVFAKFDHAENARGAGLELRPTTVLVFGSPKVGTLLMQRNQSISLELPLKISVWEDEAGSAWLAFKRMKTLAESYGMDGNEILQKMEGLLEELVNAAGVQ